uniref:SH3 domain-containing protein n=1 Tax=Magallana gigas TaxID=29159 RepID=A0A8W8L686_MAGGI
MLLGFLSFLFYSYLIIDVCCYRSELVEFYQENPLADILPGVDATLKFPFKTQSEGGANTRILGYAEAVYDYVTTATSQLSLCRGDKVAILSKTGSDKGWWKGKHCISGKQTSSDNFLKMSIAEYQIKDNSLKVTDDAKRHLDEDGCIIVRGLLSDSELQKVHRTVENPELVKHQYGVRKYEIILHIYVENSAIASCENVSDFSGKDFWAKQPQA